jgi:hypothetical protein
MSEAIVTVSALQNNIDLSKLEASAIVVHNQESYARVAQFLVRTRSLKKQIGFLLDPGIQSAQEHLNKLREDKARFVRQIDEVDAIASRPAAEWKRKEREAAEAEQKRINDERRREVERQAEEYRKAAAAQAEIDRKKREKEIAEARKSGEMGKREAERLRKQAEEDERRRKLEAERDASLAAAGIIDIKVKPSVPTVAGIRARVVYCFEVTDARAVKAGFLCPDEKAIGEKVRDDKNPEKSMAEIGGIRCWSEDRI